jgi:DNA-binding beta-propeller fold protein YncE
MASRSHLMLAFVGALLLSGCAVDDRDMVTDADASFKTDCPYPGHKKCPPEPPPEPPTGPVEPDFPGAAFDALRGPLRMALTPAGRLLVSDSRAKKIFTVDPTTRLPDGEVTIDGKPTAIAYLDDVVYVGNPSRSTIEKYDADGGGFAGDFGSGAVSHAMDMAVDGGAGLLFVVDGGDQNVKVFDGAGQLQSTISGPGIALGEFANPIGIAVNDSLQEVYVTDYGPDADPANIKIFGYDGTFVSEISGAGNCGMLGCSGGFSRPQGISVSPDGRLFVADAMLAGVLVFDRTTMKQVASLGGRDTGIPALRIPAGVVVSGDHVYVASNRTHSVEVFEGGAL